MTKDKVPPTVPYKDGLDLTDPHVAIAYLRALVDDKDDVKTARQMLMYGIGRVAQANGIVRLLHDRP